MKVSVGKAWAEGDKVARVPIIVTANDLSVLYAPLLRDGRMDKFYWEPQPSELAQVSSRSMPIPTELVDRDEVSRFATAAVLGQSYHQSGDLCFSCTA